jgi:hypothetical protein
LKNCERDFRYGEPRQHENAESDGAEQKQQGDEV